MSTRNFIKTFFSFYYLIFSLLDGMNLSREEKSQHMDSDSDFSSSIILWLELGYLRG